MRSHIFMFAAMLVVVFGGCESENREEENLVTAGWHTPPPEPIASEEDIVSPPTASEPVVLESDVQDDEAKVVPIGPFEDAFKRLRQACLDGDKEAFLNCYRHSKKFPALFESIWRSGQGVIRLRDRAVQRFGPDAWDRVNTLQETDLGRAGRWAIPGELRAPVEEVFVEGNDAFVHLRHDPFPERFVLENGTWKLYLSPLCAEEMDEAQSEMELNPFLRAEVQSGNRSVNVGLEHVDDEGMTPERLRDLMLLEFFKGAPIEKELREAKGLPASGSVGDVP